MSTEDETAKPSETDTAKPSETETNPAGNREEGPARERWRFRASTGRWAAVEKIAVYLIAVGVMAFGCHMLNGHIESSNGSHDIVIKEVMASGGGTAPLDVAGLTTLLTMREVSALRGAVIFVSFIFALMGCVLLLKGIEASIHMDLSGADTKALLKTASPGIVLILAAVVLVVVIVPGDQLLKYSSRPTTGANTPPPTVPIPVPE